MAATLAIGLAACTTDSTGPAPSPPPPPPPNTAEISITGVVDPETGEDPTSIPAPRVSNRSI
jgi:hypothetical protein